jgi:DNA-directed RNA polymerase subunit RPC12/RpoP
MGKVTYRCSYCKAELDEDMRNCRKPCGKCGRTAFVLIREEQLYEESEGQREFEEDERGR